MITYENITIKEVRTREGEYNAKKKKHVKFASPKVTKKLVFEDTYTNLEELAAEVRAAAIRNPYDKIEITFTAGLEF